MTRSFPASNAPTNALPMLPTPLPTILPTPLPTGTNDTANACSPTPHTPRALEAPNAARWRLGVPAAQGREGRKAARYRHACGNAEARGDRRRIMQSPGRGGNALRTQPPAAQTLPMRFPQHRRALQSDRKRLIALLKPYRRPICPNHVASIEGISRAGANSVFRSVEAVQARARWLIRAEHLALPLEKTGVGWGGREILPPPRFLTCSEFFAPLPKNFVHLCPAQDRVVSR